MGIGIWGQFFMYSIFSILEFNSRKKHAIRKDCKDYSLKDKGLVQNKEE